MPLASRRLERETTSTLVNQQPTPRSCVNPAGPAVPGPPRWPSKAEAVRAIGVTGRMFDGLLRGEVFKLRGGRAPAFGPDNQISACHIAV
jgi:hypothetical protein